MLYPTGDKSQHYRVSTLFSPRWIRISQVLDTYALGRSTRSFYYPATKLLTLRGAMALHMYFPGFPTALWLKFATLICTKASEGSSSRAAACLANHGVHFERRCYNIEHLLDYILLFDALADGY